MLRGYLAANGSDVYDSTLAALEHLRQYGQGGMNGVPENDVHGLVKVFPGLRGKGTHRDNSGVINQNVNLANKKATASSPRPNFYRLPDHPSERATTPDQPYYTAHPRPHHAPAT